MPQDDPIQIDATPQLAEVIDSGDAEYLANFLHILAPEVTTYTINRLDEARRTRMFSVLSAEHSDLAADLMEHFTDEHAADMIEQLEPHHAAAIIDEMDSDEQTDVLAELDDDDAEAILGHMDPQEAADARQRLLYDEDTAGDLMITEYLEYRENQDVDAVIADLRTHAQEYNEYEVRFAYLIDKPGHFKGVVTMRSLVMAPPGRKLIELKVRSPMTVSVDTQLQDLEDVFDRVDFSVIPVVDDANRLVGVVQRAAVQEALSESANEDLMKFGGIIGGEELRSLSWNSRAVRRAAFLLPNVLLSAVSVIIILLYEPLIHKLTLLAVFLPLVANLSGAAGNQAVAVSIRELALGLIRPGDWARICAKEAGIGLVNGLFIGVLLGIVAMALGWASLQLGWVETQQSRVGLVPLALVVTLAYTINSVLAVVVGGTIPLALKRLGVDPAMASSPILTTVTDMCSFLVTLTLALGVLYILVGG